MDHIKIYNYARTPAQIAWDYNKGEPIAYWDFNECSGGTIYDQSRTCKDTGDCNNGQLYLGTGGVTATGTCASSSDSFWYNGRSGKKDSAGSFDGTDDYVSVPHTIALDLREGGSISAWVKIDTLDDNTQLIVGKGDSGLTNGYILVVNENDAGTEPTKLGCALYDSSTEYAVYSNEIAVTGRWYHVICASDGSNLSFYVDGVLNDSISAVKSNDTSPLYIGNAYSVWSLDGLIDEVKIWNYALTAEQVRMEYNGGAVNFGQ